MPNYNGFSGIDMTIWTDKGMIGWTQAVSFEDGKGTFIVDDAWIPFVDVPENFFIQFDVRTEEGKHARSILHDCVPNKSLKAPYQLEFTYKDITKWKEIIDTNEEVN